MRKELDDLLCERYPKIFSQRHADMKTTAMCWGFECGDGWFDLIDYLCQTIQWHIDENAKPGTSQFVCSQVKEKFGSLRFYGSGGDERISSFIQFAEGYSGRICETCGNTGKLRGRGWLYTACDQHTKPQDLPENPDSSPDF